MDTSLTCGYTIYLDSDPDEVWQALTDAEATALWWGRANVSDWQVGSTWEHRKPTGEIDGVGEVLVSEKARRLAFTFPSGPPSRVTFDLEPRGETVRLTLTHSEIATEHLRGVVAAVWAAVLSNLKTYLETGEPLPTAPTDMVGSH